MTRKKKTIIIASSLLAILCLWALCVCVLIHGARTKVSHTEFKLSESEQFLMTDEGYVFDSGAGSSLINTESLKGTYWLCPVLFFDSNKHHILGSFRYGKECQIGKGLYISNFVYGTTSKAAEHSRVFSFINGTIGIDVMQKANWLFSLKSKKAETFSLDSTISVPIDAVILSYHGRLIPLTDLDVNGYQVKNVLVDTGFDQDLALDRATSSIDFGIQIKQDTVEIVNLNSKRIEVNKVFKSVNINSKSYQNVSVNFSNINLLGLGFMRRFDYIFWDSKHKKVYLWNDKSSENK